jgi:hypothetical protein
MAELMFNCPNKGRPIATGISIPLGDVEKRANQRNMTQCPYCRMVHSWFTREGWIKATDAEILEASKELAGVQPQDGEIVEV